MQKKKEIWFSVSIILIGIIIGSTIFIARTTKTNTEQEIIKNKNIISDISDSDILIGNPDADVIFIEYSDFKCPYCRDFHKTMKRLMENYGKDGQLAWVYRHFPRDAIVQGDESLSLQTALITNCILKDYGNYKVLEFLNNVYEKLPLNYSMTQLEELMELLEINKNSISKCTKTKAITNKIDSDMQDVLRIIEEGENVVTPFIVVIDKNGEKNYIPGSQPYMIYEHIIESSSFPRTLEI